jgi:hypothetical protein
MEKVKGRLAEIIKDFPKTKSAAEAKKLLEGLPGSQ